MRLSRAAILSKRRKNLRASNSRVKQKHKRLDAICEKAYNLNHSGLESKLSEGNGDTSVVRRSSRVRRAPVVLDASPQPPKKRRKISERNGDGRVRDRDLIGLKNESPCSTSRDLEEEESGEWRSRLRNRGRRVTFMMGSSSSYPRGRRKRFGDENGLQKQANLDGQRVDDKKGGLIGRTSMVVNSKRPGRIKASNVVSNGHEETGLGNKDKDKEDLRELHSFEEEHKDSLPEEAMKVNSDTAELEQGNEIIGSLKSKEDIANDIAQPVEQNEPMEELGFGEREERSIHREREEQSIHQGVDVLPRDHAEDATCQTDQLKDENSSEADRMKLNSPYKLHKSRIKEGRRCGLCGGGIDGRPPKKLVQDGAGSDYEAYSGSSSSDEPNYDIWDGFGDEPGWLGRLLGPINDRFGIAGIWVHQHCAVWSPEVYFAGLGCLKNVRAALCRGRVLKCSRCGRRGATVGCRVDRCPKTYHLPCARANGCIFDHRKFLIACTDHKHLFQPHGSKYFDRLKKIKAKKMKLDMRKLSDDAWRKDHEAEEKWLEKCGEDEEFLKRENKRLQRDLLRIAPVYIGGSKPENGMPYQGWESVAGLQHVIQCLKELVILPLLYPEFFHNMGLTPPRGVLLHGYPGTGKTLVVRALIGSCARGDRRIAYFARKGADCLGKYVGDAERQLRLLFQVAEKSQPSIIFFDEIDGLAPSRTRQQDQTHNSVVSTLLALLDGLKSRGSVIVIGATNRPDAIDPALRRPGRFDREIYFPLPSSKDREAILSLHTRKWPTPVAGSLLKLIARRTVGFAGADLQALCSQTAIVSLKRRCPWEKLLLAAEEKGAHGKRPLLPPFAVEERDWLEALSSAPPPCSRREAGMAANDLVSSPLPAHLFPCMLQPLSRLIVLLYLDERICLPLSLSKAGAMIKAVIVNALDKRGDHGDSWWSQVEDFLKEADIVSDIESNLVRANILVGDGPDGSFVGFDDSDDDVYDKRSEPGPSEVHNGFMQTNFLHRVPHLPENKSGYCILISGSPRSGQRHLASCILHCFLGNAVFQKLDLATMSHEGGGHMVQGLTEILVRCANNSACMIFMPRIDLWALETGHQVNQEENDSSSPIHRVTDEEREPCLSLFRSSEKMRKPQDPGLRASHLWSHFLEQVESMFFSSRLMILATSEIPFQMLPLKIRHFFGRNKPDLRPLTQAASTVPRFSVQVGENFNSEMVINSSAAKLSNDVVRCFIQLIHDRNHIHGNSSKEHESFETVDNDVNIVCPNLDSDPAVIHHSRNQNSSILPPNRKDEKGKSNLLLAISTFGYQILQYPHFAELCWVTSKLKEGPCTTINGPWKGWPFNSCIVRPSETLEKVAVASSSSNIKSKEKYGLVHGLIAVGLSAYRGVYSSLREVSTEVRKVLELLALQINAKIEGGKDRYQFNRLLSQAAYLEDMVNSWAYTLQSLEASNQLIEANLKLDTSKTCKNDLVPGDDCKQKSSKLELMGESTAGFYDKATDSLRLEGEDVSVGRAASIFNGSVQVLQSQGSTSFKDQLDAQLRNKPNGVRLESSNLQSSGNHSEFLSLKHSNGFTGKETVVSHEDGPCSSDDLISMKFSDAGQGCNQDGSLSSVETSVPSEKKSSVSNGKNMKIYLSEDQVPRHSNGPSGACLYRFCYKCLFNLYHVLQRILVSQWDLKVDSWMVEDVHDLVTSLSVNLHLVVREFCLSGSLDISLDKSLMLEKYRRFFEGQEAGTCQCEASGNRVTRPKECDCHSESSSKIDVDASQFPRHALHSELIYKNGVLDVLDPEKDISFHCKFQTLCLCSLIEYIVMTKQPSG